jgi:cold-inducible RNA-binding protein
MKLYVGNLSFQTTENDLQDLFEQHGQVKEVTLITDKMTGQSRGFGFVTMAGPTEGNAAMTALNGKEHAGRALTVNEAKPREDRPRSHSGGNRSYAGGRR